MINRIVYWILDHKVITGLSVVLFSFFVATVVLAVEKDDYREKLGVCVKERDELLAATTPPPTTITNTEAPTTQDNTTENPPERPVGFRLNPNIMPTSYDIQLYPKLSVEPEIFEGKMQVVIQVWTQQRRINMHSHHLVVDDWKLMKENTEIKTTLEYNLEDEIIIFQTESGENIATGTYILTINYHANLTGEVGFYMSRLDDGSKIATSKFEPTYARQAFPCFDEPAMKAKFSVKIVKPADYIALSNMDVAGEEDFENSEDGLSVVSFNESVPMSTYLACFIVCNFIYKEEIIVQANPFPLRVYAASEDQLYKVDLALTVGGQVTRYYIQYFNIDYPLPKLDMIGIPDFVSGAMEHWGLVTFRETSLLYDPATTSTATKQNIARVVAHEISHMWFGNLVTMAWWNDLWLNEGFATYMQYKSVNNYYPEWKMLEQFLSANTHSVMALDATLASHPIVVPVETPDEITAIFDSISYNKGGAVLRMLENFVGEESFRNGVSDYLKENQYNNTVTQNLLDKLAVYFEVGDDPHNLTHIMDTWTRQMGLPVVTVSRNTNGSYTLTQKRFLADPDAVPDKPSPFNYRWYIPITYTKKNGPSDKIVWFDNAEESVLIVPDQGDEVIKLNNDQVGYYRVNYPDSMWEGIEAELKSAETKLTVSDKANILNDVFSLAEARLVPYSRALEVSNYLTDEDNYVTWAVASTQFNVLNRIMANSLAYAEFQAHVRKLVSNVVEKIGWEATVEEPPVEEPHIVKMTRSVVLNLACVFGHEACLKESRDRFLDWLDRNTAIDPDIKGTVYFYGIERTDDAEWLKFFDKYLEESDAQEKARMRQSLAATRNPSRLKWFLQKAWDEKVVRSQDYFSVMQSISSNPVGTPIVWDYFRENWNNIKDRFTLNSRTLGTTVPAITRSFATNQKLQEMKDFFEANPEAGAGATARQQALENVQNNIKWMERNEPAVKEWLENNSG